MISQKQIDVLKKEEGVEWVTALRTETLRKMIEDKRGAPSSSLTTTSI